MRPEWGLCFGSFVASGVQPAACSQQHAASGVQPAACSQRPAASGGQLAACSQRRAADDDEGHDEGHDGDRVHGSEGQLRRRQDCCQGGARADARSKQDPGQDGSILGESNRLEDLLWCSAEDDALGPVCPFGASIARASSRPSDLPLHG